MFLHLDLSSLFLCLEIMTCPEAGCYHLQFTCCISGSNRFNMKLICRLEVNSFISLPDSQWLQSSAPLSWAIVLGWMHGWLGRRAVRYAVGRIIETDEAVLPNKMQNHVNISSYFGRLFV